MKKILVVFALLAIIASSCAKKEKEAKYVFYFIGDGMGFSHIALTEAFKALPVIPIGDIKPGSEPLGFTQFPVMGMATNYSASNWITCSSAAGTALSTGFKTNNHMLGVAPDSSDLTSIAYMIHNSGFKVGIMSTVPIDHATPGAFYASSAKRSDYYNITKQLPGSGFEYFAGGGFYGVMCDSVNKDQPDPSKTAKFLAMLDSAGYTVACGTKEYDAKVANSKKMVFLQPGKIRGSAVPYASNRKEGDLSLSDMVSNAIKYLNNDKGFFMMVEGGQIDWAAHSNDILNTIGETLDFDRAISIAYEFYLQHPDQTLIVVTADHETGGLTLGKQKGYVFDLTKLPQNNLNGRRVESDSTEALSVDTYMSHEYNVDSLSVRTSIGWTTSSHTGGAIPVFAIGAHSQDFAGRQDNTDIPKKICAAMGVEFNPSLKK